MSNGMKRCRVCGKEYKACHTLRHNPNVFRWQDVACSPECGAIYLRRILESRGKVEKTVDDYEDIDCEMYTEEEMEEFYGDDEWMVI